MFFNGMIAGFTRLWPRQHIKRFLTLTAGPRYGIMKVTQETASSDLSSKTPALTPRLTVDFWL